MKFKIAVEMELDLTEKDTEMIETNPAKFCEEFAKTLASYATVDIAEQGAKCVYVDHAWMCDRLCDNDQDYKNGILNGVLDKTISQKVKRDPFGAECPNCGGRIVLPSTYTFGGKMINIRCDYCYSCGQALDWSEE